MHAKVVLLMVFIAFFQGYDAASVNFIKKCKIDDHKCQKESTKAALQTFVAGIPELGVEPLDPLHYDTLDASSKELKLILSNVAISGARNCIVKKLQVKNSQLNVKALCELLELNSQYEMGGKLLFLPIEGKGKAYAALKKVLLSADADIVEKTGKDGKVHWDITTWKHSYDLQGQAVIDLENLFEGNEVLGRAARDLLKSSANEVVSEIGPPVIKALIAKVVKVVDKFFREVPLEELVEQ